MNNTKIITIKNNVLIMWLFLLNILDFYTTKLMVDMHGFIVESNPILYYLMEKTETVWIIMIVKLLVFAALFYFTNKATNNFKLVPPHNITTILYLLITVFVFIVIGNIALLTFY